MPRASKPRPLSPYRFLVGRWVDAETLARAERLAPQWGCAPHHVLVDLGDLSADAYTAALAEAVGVPVIDPPVGAPLSRALAGHVLVSALDRGPEAVAGLVGDARGRGVAMALTSRPPPTRSEWEGAEAVAAWATHGLALRHPALSASTTVTLGQALALTVLAGLMIGGFVIDAELALATLLGVLTLPFVFVIALRGAALGELIGGRRRRRARRAAGAAAGDETLPVYSVLVPLYREARMVRDVVGALSRLDYPVDKLDVVIVVEADDAPTQDAIRRLGLPAQMRMVVAPGGMPRTKPRALNVGLAHARGAFVTIYDAEDHPEPDQLRRALAVFKARADTVGCVQARLGIDNAHRNWLTRQFAIEYAALFDAILPLLERTGLPVPLGGTSNHFPRRLLEHVGAWDPYNVTEDADLGIRLARMGWQVAVIESTTWEEAPRRWRSWLNQRTRWLKGWMQTTLVHMRHPLRLMHDLGEARFLGFQALMGGLVLAALVHPWFYLLLAYDIWAHRFFSWPQTLIGQSFWGLASLNLFAGYLISMLLGLAAAVRRGRWRLGLAVVLLPFYWLAISLAAHRALIQLIRRPFHWEKTPHTPRAKRVNGR